MKAALQLSIIMIVLSSIACADPCGAPLTYRVGTVDERFRVTRGEVLTALDDAESMWEDGSKKNLFRYDRDGRVLVNFIYDERQKTAQERERRRLTIESQGSSAEQLRREIDKNKAKLETLQREYRDASASLEARVAAHDRDVAHWNSRGGAPRDIHDALARQAAELRSAASALDERRRALNAVVDRVNSLTERYNTVAKKINSDIDAVNTKAGWEFNQGRFIRDADGVRIEVYEYVDHDDLVHVLAHELGHALGLEHNDDPQSIMYRKSAVDSPRLTAQDIDALRTKCGE